MLIYANSFQTKKVKQNKKQQLFQLFSTEHEIFMLENDLLYNVKPELKTVEKLLCCYENFFLFQFFFVSKVYFIWNVFWVTKVIAKSWLLFA